MAGDQQSFDQSMADQIERLTFALQAAEIGTWDYNLRTGQAQWSSICKELFGLPADAPVTAAILLEQVHPDDRDRVAQANARVLEPQSDGQHLLRFRTLNPAGGLRWVEAKGRVIQDNQGRPLRFAGIVQDVTERVLARQHLEASELKLRSIIESTPSAIAIGLLVGRELVIDTPNQGFLDTVGKGQAIVGKSLRTVMPELESQPFLQLLDQVYTTGQAYQAMSSPVWIRHQGELTLHYFNVSFIPLLDVGGDAYAILDVSIDVTQQVRAQQTIEDSEARFRSIVEQAPMAIGLLKGREMIIEAGNRKIFEVWGKDPSITGMRLLDALPEIDTQLFMGLLQRVYDTGDPYYGNGVLAQLVRQGQLQTVYFDFTYTPLRQPDGTITGVMVLATDVTAQVLARQAIEASEAKLRSVIATAPAGMGLFVGRELVIEMPNQTFVDMVGKGPAIEGKPLREVMPELLTESQPFLQILDEVFTTGQMYQSFGARVAIRRADVMTHNFYNITYSPLLDDRGQVYAILEIAVDVTPEIRARQQLQETEEAWRGAIELAQLGTWQIDLTTGVIIFSPRLRAWYGIGPGETITEERLSRPIRPADWLSMQAAFTQAVGSDGFYNVEYTIDATPDGPARMLHSQGRAYFDEQGIVQKISGTVQDITEQRQRQAALEKEVHARTQALSEANALLLRSNDNLQQFAYIASHDLQEPLRKIQSFGDLLKSRHADALGDGIDHLDRMQGAASRMSTLIRDLLAFSRVSTQQDTQARVSLTPLVQSVLTDLDLRIQETGAVVTLGPLPTVQGDAPQLSQLMQNLVSNALKFHQPGVPPRIGITADWVAAENLPKGVEPSRAALAYHRLAISDNGIGFDEKYLSRIFQVFQRLHGKRQYEGTGIGLAICERVVINHGGAITATSQPGQGTTFSVYLPV